MASGDGQHRGGGLVEADKLSVENATFQMQWAEQGRRLEVQRPADPDPAQADASCICRPVFSDQQMPEHRRTHRPLFAPGLHLDKIERPTATVDQLTGCSTSHHFFFQWH